ncbi:EAL domain-containing protein [bacterium]|nr:MAG: EAL domain-containing protein [bacterium]
METNAVLHQRSPNPLVLLTKLLLIIMVAESIVMVLLPHLVEQDSVYLSSLGDSALLATLSAPFIWRLIVMPIRTEALTEVARTKAALGYIEDAVIYFDERGNIESLNSAAEKMFGYAPGEVMGQKITRIIPGFGDFPFLAQGTGRSGTTRRESTGCRKGGVCFLTEVSISKLSQGGVTMFIAIIHDITERKTAERLLAEQKMFFENILQTSEVPLFVISPEHKILIWNKACEELTGVRAEAMMGLDEPWKAFYVQKRPVLADLVADGDVVASHHQYGSIEKSSFIPGGLRAEEWFENLNGRRRYINFKAAPARNPEGELVAVMETLEDITDRKRYEEQLEYLSTHDELTDLPNRNLLTDRIRQALLVSHRNHQEVAVLFIDIDNFKIINDSLGHDHGDLLLQQVAKRLTSCIRSGDTVARQGGDEFVAVITQHEVTAHIPQIAAKILEKVSAPIKIKEHEIIVTCSVGISIFPKDGEDVQTLLKNADVAMYRAKEQGRNSYGFFTEDMNVTSFARMTMEKHLRRALEREELILFYQPKVDLGTGRITGMEALVRWRNPELGIVSPGNFIPLAEETGLIEPIGEWVLRTACAQNKAWQEAGLPPIPVAVNLSVRQLRHINIAGLVDLVLRQTGLDPCCLDIEITESMVLRGADEAAAILDELKRLGVCLTMDDFGTGYSSLSYLSRFHFDKLKIDQSFMRDITTKRDNEAIARAIIAMSHSLHLKVVAEGVETREQVDLMRKQDCDEIQGSYFSRPVPTKEMETLLREDRRLNLV